MPFAVALVILDLMLVVHAAKTGRLSPWAFIILMLPGIGAIAYVVVELIPDWMGSAQGQKTQRSVALGLGRPQDVITTLDGLRRRWPDYQSADAHLLYARSLELLGRNDEALVEYHALSSDFVGAEARVRYGLLLAKVGRQAESRIWLSNVLTQLRRAPAHVGKAQARMDRSRRGQYSG